MSLNPDPIIDDRALAAESSAGVVLFVYGSLMHESVWRGVSGAPWREACTARLDGWRRMALRERDYPGLRSEPHASTVGLCIGGVDPASLARLDAFEGEPYERIPVRVTLGAPGLRGHPADSLVGAYAYAWRDSSQCLEHEWDAVRFEREQLAGFLARHGLSPVR